MRLYLAIVFMFGVFCSIVGAQNSRPPVPFVDRGACPFECCTYRDWTVDKVTAVRSAMRDGASIAFRLRKGERVKGVTGVVTTSEPGEVRVLKRTKIGKFNAQPGDTLYLLTYVGEGFHRVWYKGKITEEETYDKTIFRQIKAPKSVWWVKVRNSRGQTGWSREPDNFGNKDQCGN